MDNSSLFVHFSAVNTALFYVFKWSMRLAARLLRALSPRFVQEHLFKIVTVKSTSQSSRRGFKRGCRHVPIVALLFLLVFTFCVYSQEALCVRVKIEIEQTVTLERQGFRATMKVSNGGESELTGFRVGVNFADEEGRPVAATTNANDTCAGLDDPPRDILA